MPSRRVALVAVWVVGAVVATGTGVLAVQQVAARVSEAPPAPLSAAGVEDALAATPAPSTPSADPTTSAPPPAPTATGPTATSPAAAPTSGAPVPATAVRSFSTSGGSIGVTCEGGVPRLLYATPAQGWTVDEREQDDGRVEVRFRSDEVESRLRVGCGPDGPVEQPDDD